MKKLRENVARNIKSDVAPQATPALLQLILVDGHELGLFDNFASPSSFSSSHAHFSDRLFVADCLWMPWHHENLRRSIGYFLKMTASARAWVIAGFFGARAIREECGVEVERM
ncbi:hypothetical protein V8C42DRAFT_224007 [Trichoderma barbatum]